MKNSDMIDVEDPSQRFVNQDFLSTYDNNVNEEDPIKESLASNLEEDYEEYGLHPMFGSLYPEKDDQLKEGKDEEDEFFLMFGGLYPDEDDQFDDEEPTDDIANYEKDDIVDDKEVDEDLSGEVSNFNGEDVDYVDFLGIDNI